MLRLLRFFPPPAIVVADVLDLSAAVVRGNSGEIIRTASKCAQNGFRLSLGALYASFCVASVIAGFFVEPVTGTASKGE